MLGLHIVTVYWIAHEVESKTDTYGAIGAALALLLWSYLLGRLITASAVINASLWQRREDRAERRAARARMHQASPGPEGSAGLHSGRSTGVRAEHRRAQGGYRWPSRAGEAEPATTESVPATPKKLPRWRRILVGVLVVLVCLLVPISVVGVWVRNTILHTDQFVDTMAPLADDPAVQEAISIRVTNTLIEATDLEAKIADRLPDRAKAAAPFIAGGAEQVVRDATLRIVESDQFERLWEGLLRRAHSQVVAVLQGEGTDNVTTKNGQVVVRLGPVVERVATALSNSGISFFDDIDATRVNRQIVLFESEDLRKGQGAVDLLDKVANYLPFVALILLAIALWLSGNRRRTILRTALGIALGMALLLTLFNLGRTVYLDALPASVRQDSAAAIYDQVLSFLRTAVRTVFILAIIVAIAAWLAGPVGLRRGYEARCGAIPLVTT